jgi:hypothetical protein
VADYAKQSWVYCFRGGAATTLDCLNIAGGTNGSWENAIVYDGNVVLPTTGSCASYAPASQEGRFAYLNIYTASVINQMYRFDVKNRALTINTSTPYLQAGTAAVGERIACTAVIDGSDKYTQVLLVGHLATYCMEYITLV